MLFNTLSARNQWIGTTIALFLLALSAWLSNTLLFQQSIQGTTTLTQNIPHQLGTWIMVQQSEVSKNEIKGLETTDIVKRTYTNGQDQMELVVAYIAHSSRKSAHAQEACLRGAGALVGSISDFAMTNGRVHGKLISIDNQNRRQWVCYWYKIGTTYTAKYLQSSLLMFLGGLTGKQQHGASLVRLLTPETQRDTEAQIKARIEDFTQFLLPELEKNLP